MKFRDGGQVNAIASMAIAAIGSRTGSELCFFFRWRVTIMTESPRMW
jgi:hypothetical protein